MRFHSVILSCAALIGAGIPPAAQAGVLQVNPVLIEISPGRRIGTVTVRNMENVPVTIRAYGLAWSQVEGDDRYDETDAVIASPPVFTIPAGGTQILRVGLRGGDSTAARSYRLIVEEVPEARPGGVQVALRLNLPLYSMISAGSESDLSWSARSSAGGGWVLEAANRGTGYVRLDHQAARAATGLTISDETALGTVLPGATRRWTLAAGTGVLDQARLQRITRSEGRDAAGAVRHGD